LQGFEELRGPHFKPGFVQVEKTFHRVGPSQPTVAGDKLRISLAHSMDDQVGWRERVSAAGV
jgi:hypothetical protein